MGCLFTKDWDKITFEDIEEMVSNAIPENVNLDYKEKFDKPENVAKLICALANTIGGFIIFGVCEKEGSNRPEKIVGLEYTEKELEAKASSSSYEHIDPPVFIRTKYLESTDSALKVFIVHVPESNLTPHAVDQDTRVYIRYRDQKKPISQFEYRLADLPYVEWLKNRRSKSVQFKENLIKESARRFETLGFWPGGHMNIEYVIAASYPRLPLIDAFRFRDVVNTTLAEFKKLYPDSILQNKEYVHYNGGIVNVVRTNINQAAVDYNWHGMMHFAYGYKGTPDESGRLAVNSYTLLEISHQAFHLGVNYMKLLNFVSGVEITYRISGIANTALDRWDYSFEKGGAVCKAEDTIQHIQTYTCLPSDDSFFEFMTEFLSRLAYLYGMIDRHVEYATKLVEHMRGKIAKLRTH